MKSRYVTGFLTTGSFPDKYVLACFTPYFGKNEGPIFSSWILQYQCRDFTVSRLQGCCLLSFNRMGL